MLADYPELLVARHGNFAPEIRHSTETKIGRKRPFVAIYVNFRPIADPPSGCGLVFPIQTANDKRSSYFIHTHESEY
jgi:hypothetical protein